MEPVCARRSERSICDPGLNSGQDAENDLPPHVHFLFFERVMCDRRHASTRNADKRVERISAGLRGTMPRYDTARSADVVLRETPDVQSVSHEECTVGEGGEAVNRFRGVTREDVRTASAQRQAVNSFTPPPPHVGGDLLLPGFFACSSAIQKGVTAGRGSCSHRMA